MAANLAELECLPALATGAQAGSKGMALGLTRLTPLAFDRAGARRRIPRFQFAGPAGGGEPLRLLIFATIHGDEPESGVGLMQVLRELARHPEVGQGYLIRAYPLCIPTGLEDRTRHPRGGPDLNRQFWQNSTEPEVRLLEGELLAHPCHGMVTFHCDDTSHGLYGFLSGREPSAVLSEHLLEPALRAAERFLPINCDPWIDGFRADRGVLATCYDGVLRSPGHWSPPFEITFETPQCAPWEKQIQAFVAATVSILGNFRRLQGYALNLWFDDEPEVDILQGLG